MIETMAVNWQMGNLAEWVGSIGTVGAFAGTLWLLRHEQRSRRSDEADRRAAQAQLVAGWLGPSEELADDLLRQTAHIFNGSNAPIYTVALVSSPTFYWPASNDRIDWLEISDLHLLRLAEPDVPADHRVFINRTWPVVLPGQEVEATIVRDAKVLARSQGRLERSPLFGFSDVTGVRWRRGALGQLVREPDGSVDQPWSGAAGTSPASSRRASTAARDRRLELHYLVRDLANLPEPPPVSGLKALRRRRQ